MESVDLEVLRHTVRWLDEGFRLQLITVVKTWGSSPRPVGSMLLVREDGVVVGSVSGGCIEDDLVHQVRTHGIANSPPSVLKYGVSAEEARRFGLPCGGTIELVAERLGSDSSPIRNILHAVLDGMPVVRRLCMSSGRSEIRQAEKDDAHSFDGAYLTTVYGPRFRLLVIGAGQLSKFLCEMAAGLGFDVTVCDPRDEYHETWDVPGVQIVTTMPDDIVVAMRLDAHSAVIALTHDPKLDDLALMEALRSPAFYVAALGSRRNNSARKERLREFDLSAAQVQRLRGPAGIYIGSKTPPEIAVSILAELIAVKNHAFLVSQFDVHRAKDILEAEPEQHGRPPS